MTARARDGRGARFALRTISATGKGARMCCAAAALSFAACGADSNEPGAAGGRGASTAGAAGAHAGSAGTNFGRSGSGGTVSTGGSTSSSGTTSTGGATSTAGTTSTMGGTSPDSAGRAGQGGLAGKSAGGANGGGQAGMPQGGASGAAGAGLAGVAGAGTSGAGGGSLSPAPPVGKKFVGNIDTRGQLRSDFTKYWNQFSAENAGKWDSVERRRGEMNWSALDRMYGAAKQGNVIIKHHTLVWGRQQPGWLADLSQEEQRAEVEEWIRLFCERYPDTALIDVVNEPPPHTTPPYVAALGGAGASGYDWIAQAFKWAHQYCPKAILILNDFNNIEYASDNAHTIDIVNKIKAAGAPVHAVGAQAHDAYMLPVNTVQMYIDRIVTQTGLPVYISEYDIPIADDNQQKSVMQSQFTMFWNHENIKGITLWGYVVGSTWKANTGMLSSNGTMRPAMVWLLDFLKLQ